MSHRTIEISWTPRSQNDWRIFTAARQEAAAVWNWLVEAHANMRDTGEPWLSRGEWQKQAKGRFPNLLAQSVQQTIADFCEAVTSTIMLRRNGHLDANYPSRMPKYRCVIFTNQAVKIRDGVMVLPCGQAGKLKIKIPQNVVLPGRLMEVRLHFGKIQLVCKVPTITAEPNSIIGVDLGVNTMIAATDGDKAILVSGRGVKAAVQLRNKRMAEISSKQSRQTKGSRRFRKLQRRKYRMLDKTRRQVRDLCHKATHKATHKVADAFPNAKAYVGEPFNDAAQKMSRVQAQQVSQTCNAVIIAMLAYKLCSAETINEAYSSQTCPVCGVRNKCRRIYRCACGCEAPRDVIGSVNIRSIGMDGKMVPGRSVPNTVSRVHPHKYPGVNRVVMRTPCKSLGITREASSL